MPAKLISRRLTPVHHSLAIRSLIEFGKLCGPLAHSVLYPQGSRTRLALKLFRGEPAISGFDWNFSAIHKSSPPFSTDVWFGPPWNFTPTSTCSWIGHPVSGPRHSTLALFRLAFASAPVLQTLTSPRNVTRRSVLQKVRGRTLRRTPTACKHRVSGSLSLPSRGSFHLSLTVLCAIGRHLVFSLGRWSSLLPAGFLVSCGTPVTYPAFSAFAYGALTPSGWASHPYSACASGFSIRTSTPPGFTPPVWAPALSLAATQAIDVSFSSSGYLDVSLPRVPSGHTIFSYGGDGALPPPGFPIRIPWDLCPLAAPPSFSQLAASFFGVWRLGIHPALFLP